MKLDRRRSLKSTDHIILINEMFLVYKTCRQNTNAYSQYMQYSTFLLYFWYFTFEWCFCLKVCRFCIIFCTVVFRVFFFIYKECCTRSLSAPLFAWFLAQTFKPPLWKHLLGKGEENLSCSAQGMKKAKVSSKVVWHSSSWPDRSHLADKRTRPQLSSGWIKQRSVNIHACTHYNLRQFHPNS